MEENKREKMLTKTYTLLYLCVCVERAYITTPLPRRSVRQRLREAAVEMCAPPQHTNTQTNKCCMFSAMGPSVGLCLFSVTPPSSFTPSEPSCSLSSFFLSAHPKRCKCQAD